MGQGQDSVDELIRLCEQLRQEISDREVAEVALAREYLLRSAEDAIRVQIASMDQPEHLCRVVEEIGVQLRRLGIAHDSCTIQVINEQGTDFVSFSTYIHREWQDEFMAFITTGSRGELPSHAELYPWVVEVWKTGQARSVGCTEIGGRGATFSDLSLVDVAFSHGTLAINKKQIDAFDGQDVDLLERLARVLSEGFQRFLDIVERKKAEDQLQDSLREKEVLLLEIHHRVKNNLQTVSSMLSLQAANIDDEQMRQKLRDSENRVHSMAFIHETLYQSRDLGRVDLAEYMGKLVANVYHSYNLDTNRIHLDVRVEGMFTDIDSAISCGLLVNELVTNALKYAFVAEREGRIAVVADRHGEAGVVLRVSDDGVGIPEGVDFRQSRSLGLQIVNMLVKQLQGTIELHRGVGTEWEIVFPLRN